MNNSVDVQEQLKTKNRELYINKLIIDLEKAMESLLMFYFNYCDTLSLDVKNKIVSFLDNKENSDNKDMVSSLINTFFTMIKDKLNVVINGKLESIKNSIHNIDTFDYEKKLSSEAVVIANQMSDFYQENVYMLIDELSSQITTSRLDFKDYLLNSLYRKLINTLKDKLVFSVKLVNNNYDENTIMLKSINQKTLK